MFRAAALLVDTLWAPGILLLVIFGGAVFLDGSEAREWGLFFALGTLFPALVLAVAVLPHLYPRLARACRTIGGVAFAALGGMLLFADTSAWLLALAFTHVVTLALWETGAKGIRHPARLLAVWGYAPTALCIGVVAVSWSVAARLAHWEPLDQMIASNATSIGALAAAVIGSSLLVAQRPASKDETTRRWPAVVSSGAAGLLFVLLALNTRGLFTDDAQIHWFWAVGPVQLVREGGWLLWDVHSTYGFLNTLLVALTPVPSSWQSFYLVNAALLVASASLVLQALRAAAGRKPGASVVAVVLAAAAVFLMPGGAENLTGVQTWPSVGPFRFIWCFVLLAILWRDYVRSKSSEAFFQVRWMGSAAWILGCFWSFESAAYCTAIWIPASLLLAWNAARVDATSPQRALAGWLGPPLALLFAASACVAAFYWIRLGSLPDPLVFIGPALTFTVGGTNTTPIRPDGVAWVLVLALAIPSTLAAVLVGQGARSLRALAVVAGSFGAIWSTSSYFVAHSHDTQPLNLAPLWVAALALVLAVLRREQIEGAKPLLLRGAIAPLFAMLIFLTLGNERALQSFAAESARRFATEFRPLPNVEPLLEPAPPDVQALLKRAGVRAGESVTSLASRTELLTGLRLAGDDVIRWEQPALLPLKPVWAIDVLPIDRQRILMKRWVARGRPEGWILLPDVSGMTHLLELLEETHEITARSRSGRMQVMRLTLRPAV